MPLARLTAEGMAVLVMHHPKQGDTLVGQAARGSGALSGYVDIIVEMTCYSPGAFEDRRRKLRCFSRYEETPRRLLIEWTPDGTDYLAHGEWGDEEFDDTWRGVRAVLEEAPHMLTRAEILDRWPADEGRRPNDVTLWKWLDRAVAEGRACKDGSGKRSDPFRYWLPGQLEKWHADPFSRTYLDQIALMRTLPPNLPTG